ncbi:lipocalin-like domain-containing protein [Pseudaestuariivita atlantica]|uniref:Iron ABC transporter permease n=1 Tax=Pseudaestuariivita atlantica TaxID=1317121 RepID=A0A0L1JKC6_9RHOB|nr:lipocalin-like domain-containing protein [Pseudaestuariivita atlantica]KNG92172.1 iron ABC transporter permease [Pseudaestuariivita atlantica]
MDRRLFLSALLGAPLPALAQGFAGLGTDAEGFAVPVRGTPLTFPADHAAHPDYRIEWWYLTATLTGEDGRDYGLQWTLFRSALAPGRQQLWLGHAALTTPDAHYSAERRARGGIGQADVLPPLDAFIDDWHMTSTATSGDPMSALSLAARAPDFRYALSLTATGPLVLHGDDGYSVKSEDGQASYYYSQPFLTAEGEIETAEGRVVVRGEAWIDREWSSQPLSPDQTGWDWFSLSFDTGERLMAFGLRDRDGSRFTSGTWISADGTPAPLAPNRIRLTPLGTARVAGRTLPVRWRLTLPERGLDVTTEPLRDDSWMQTSIPYWEGPLRFSGSHEGRGYLEMTGYE